MPDMNAVITARIAEKLAEGMCIREAIDAVLGVGTVAKLAGEIYDAFNGR